MYTLAEWFRLYYFILSFHPHFQEWGRYLKKINASVILLSFIVNIKWMTCKLHKGKQTIILAFNKKNGFERYQILKCFKEKICIISLWWLTELIPTSNNWKKNVFYFFRTGFARNSFKNILRKVIP